MRETFRSARRPNVVKSVVKVLDILEYLAASKRSVTVSELSRARGFHVATAHRLLRTLAHRGYVEQQADHAYRLRPRIVDLGSAYLASRDLVGMAQPQLDALRDALGETTHLGVYSGGEVVELTRALGRHTITVLTRPGQRLPAYCTALGKVLLAELPPDELAQYLREVRLEKRAPCTITDRRVLGRELVRVRSRHWALDDEEFSPDLCCLGVPLRNGAGLAIAALSVAVPKMRFRQALVPKWIKRLNDAAAAISRGIGFSDGRA